MTPDEALLLEAGRELDEWIAVNVMGRSPDEFKPGPPPHYGRVIPLLYSRKWYVFDVEQKLFARGWLLAVNRMLDGWAVSFAHVDGKRLTPIVGAAALSHAICRAAICVVKWEEENK